MKVAARLTACVRSMYSMADVALPIFSHGPVAWSCVLEPSLWFIASLVVGTSMAMHRCRFSCQNCYGDFSSRYSSSIAHRSQQSQRSPPDVTVGSDHPRSLPRLLGAGAPQRHEESKDPVEATRWPLAVWLGIRPAGVPLMVLVFCWRKACFHSGKRCMTIIMFLWPTGSPVLWLGSKVSFFFEGVGGMTCFWWQEWRCCKVTLVATCKKSSVLSGSKKA